MRAAGAEAAALPAHLSGQYLTLNCQLFSENRKDASLGLAEQRAVLPHEVKIIL